MPGAAASLTFQPPTLTFEPPRCGSLRGDTRGRRGRGLALAGAGLAPLVAGGVLLALMAKARPSFDAMGWLAWGHQVLHWDLNTDGAPSWKPLAFLFTFPYALAGHAAQLWLWTLTAELGGMASVAIAAHLGWRLTPRVPGREWARLVGGALAGIGVLAMNGYLHLLLITNTDPLTVALLLAAIDAHLSRRPRLAYWLLFAAGLDRPETWVLLVLYGAWCWRTVPGMRATVLLLALATPASWFIVPALTSRSWMTPGNLDMNLPTAIHGNKLLGVLDRLRSLMSWPAQLGVLIALAVALWRRDATRLVLFGAVAVWCAVEVAFALHGFSAVARYLIEPAAVLFVLLGATAGELLCHAQLPALGVGRRAVLGLIGPAIVGAGVVALLPGASVAARTDRALIRHERRDALALRRLGAVIAADGGARAVRACGQPVSFLGYQSTLAWELGMNVGRVGFHPGRAIDSGRPIVFFKPHDFGWIVRADNEPPAQRARCRRLDRQTRFG